jgi:hypothetical protein
MNIHEILVAMDTLSFTELQVIQEKLDSLRENEDFEETPEMLAAIDEGLRSSREEGSIPLEQVIENMKSWKFTPPDSSDPKDEA